MSYVLWTEFVLSTGIEVCLWNYDPKPVDQVPHQIAAAPYAACSNHLVVA